MNFCPADDNFFEDDVIVRQYLETAVSHPISNLLFGPVSLNNSET